MALQVWLPLVENSNAITNYGLSGLKFQRKGSASYSTTEGKIGNYCYYNNNIVGSSSNGVISDTAIE